MDDADCSTEHLYRTLRQFVSINRTVGRNGWVVKKIINSPIGKHLHIVDCGCGGGDFARFIVRQCQKKALSVRIDAIDADKRTIAFARENSSSYPQIHYHCANALAVGNWAHEQSYVTANHFLHHLSWSDIELFFAAVARSKAAALLATDLARSRAAFAGFWLLSAVAWRNSFARADGLISIRRGFTPGELQSRLLPVLPGASVSTLLPGRVIVQWRRKE